MANPFFDHPILNSPYKAPTRHWELAPQGQPTQQILEKRRRAEFITPIPKPKKRRAAAAEGQKDMVFDEGKGLSSAKQQHDPTSIVNELRSHVDQWRARERAKPEGLARTMESLRRLAWHARQRVLPKSALGKACDYLLSQWSPLSAHLHHGESRLDNNLVENALRPSCIGKKNWLFIGHPGAGQRSAILYSLIVSCQRHGKDPLAYLRDLLTRLPRMTNQDDLRQLTPARWQPASA